MFYNNLRKFCIKSVLHKNIVQLTKHRFPNVKRGSYTVIDSTDVHYFKKILGVTNLISGDELNSYNEDWLKSVSGKCL